MGAISGSKATPEAPAGLRPPGYDPERRVVRDGKVAVLVSGGFGAGWFSWNDQNKGLLFDPKLVAAVESGDQEALMRRAEEIEPGGYWGGAGDLAIEWVPLGSIFRIDEYDGSESLVLQNDDDWIVA